MKPTCLLIAGVAFLLSVGNRGLLKSVETGSSAGPAWVQASSRVILPAIRRASESPGRDAQSDADGEWTAGRDEDNDDDSDDLHFGLVPTTLSRRPLRGILREPGVCPVSPLPPPRSPLLRC